MFKPLKILVAAGVLAATASMASAAPANVGQIADGLSEGVVKVQGYDRRDDRHERRHERREERRFDRACRRGPGGWYRLNRFGERRPCRRWDGRGRRPDACVKFGPVWFCDY